MRTSPTSDEETLGLWYGLGRLYAGAGDDGRQATMLGFAVACAVGAAVLLSAPLAGPFAGPLLSAGWAGPLAATVPVLAGLLVGGGSFGWRRRRLSAERDALRRALAARGEDPDRPTLGGLGAYYDAQLVLLRSEYEVLRDGRTKRALRSARLLEEVFGFAPTDPFETGPLNVAPDTAGMRALRERWEGRLASGRALGRQPPGMGLGEDLAHRVFPREMDVPAELATRRAYLEISCGLLRGRYGKRGGPMPEEIRRRAERDAGEYRALVRR